MRGSAAPDPSRAPRGAIMKNIIGKIFVFAVFVMSLVLMSFAVAIYSSHVNWQDEARKTKETLDKLTQEKAGLTQEITRLTKNVAASEAARDQVIAKFQQAIEQKDSELASLRVDRDDKLADMQKKINDLAHVEEALTEARQEAEKLHAEIREMQLKVDTQVDRAAEIAAKLHEKESFLEIANERKAQLEKQVANARLLLKQNGLSLDSLPKDRVPTINGVVMAVADDAIEVSLGFDDGLQTGHQIEVYRNDEYLGRAIVRSVKPDRAVAVLVREYVRGVVQRGDKVTTRLKA